VVVEIHDDLANNQRTSNRRLVGPGVDNVLAVDSQQRNLTTGVDDTPKVVWTFTDRLGTVRDLYQASSDTRGLISYDAFGRPHDTTGLASKANVFYAGRELDYDTRLYNNRARWYDPASGRFISEDPIASDTNPYRYAGNSPANFTDPSGLRTSFWEDPLEWGYGRGGAFWDVGADDSWRGTLYRDYMAEGVRATLGDQYLAQAGGWELFFGTSAAVTVGVFTGAGVAALGASVGAGATGLGAFGWGLGTSVVAGAAAGGMEYLTMTGAAAGYNAYYGYGADTRPTLGGLAGSMAGGAVGGGVFHLGGTTLNALGRGLAAGARYLGRQALGAVDDMGARLFAPRLAFAEGLVVGAWQATMSAARAGSGMALGAQPFGAAAMGGVLGNQVYFATAAGNNGTSSRVPVWRDASGSWHDARGRFTRGPRASEWLSGSRTFRRGSKIYKLEQGNASSGWKHIWDRHIDPARFLKKSKFGLDASENQIFHHLEQTIKHGKKTTFGGRTIFEKRIRMGSQTRTFRVTINPDDTIQTFHPLG